MGTTKTTQKTTIDWWRFRTKSNPFETFEAIRPAFGSVAHLMTFETGGKGHDGWERSGLIKLVDHDLGVIDYGGDSQRDWVRVNIPGTGCSYVEDWSAAASLVDVLQQAELKRVDVALTTFAGEVSHESVIAAHEANLFSSGGRQPEYRTVENSNPRQGRTIYIGNRKGQKMLRAYEKGFELLKDTPASLRDTVTHIDGNPVDLMYRLEVEFKDVDKVIPWPALVERDTYFVGAYPYLASLLPGVAATSMMAKDPFGRAAQLQLQAQLDNCRRAYGKIIRAAVDAYGGDSDRVLRQIMAMEPSQALIEAGILTVEHP
jgi:phage replication initiation protein